MTIGDIALLIIGALVVFGAGFAFGKFREEFKQDRQEQERFLARQKAKKEEAEALFPNSPASPLVPAEVAYLPDEQRYSLPVTPFAYPSMDDLPPPDYQRVEAEKATLTRELSETVVSAAPWTPYPSGGRHLKPTRSTLARFEPDQQKPRWLDVVGPDVILTTTDIMYLDDIFGDNSTPVQVKGKRRKIDMEM